MSENHDILALRAALRSPKQNDKLKAIHTLGELHEVSAVPDLLDALHDSDHNIRRAAANALMSIGDKTALKGLIAGLDAENDMLRMTIAATLGKIGSTKVISALIERLMYESEGHVRRAIVDALREIGDTSAVPTLLDAMKNGQDDWEREKASRALGEISDVSIVPELVTILRDSNRELRGLAAAALADIGDKSVVPDLVNVLREGNPSYSVIRAIGTLGDARVVPDLVAALAQADSQTRPFLIQALDKIGDTVALSSLVQQLTFDEREFGSSGRRIYTLAEAALRRIGTPEALAAVEQWRKENRLKLLRHRIQDTASNIYNFWTDEHIYPLAVLGVAIIIMFLIAFFGTDAPLWQSILIGLSPIWTGIIIIGVMTLTGVLRTWVSGKRK